MVLQGRVQTLEHWLRMLPEAILEDDPRLLYWLGACCLPLCPADGRRHFAKALAMFEAQGRKEEAAYCLCGVLDTITFGFASFKELDHWIPRLNQISGEYDDFVSQEIKGRLTFSMLHALSLRQPDHTDFQIWEERGIEILQKSASAEVKVRLLQPLLLYRTFAGKLAEAEFLVSTYQELAGRMDITPLAAITLRDLQAFYFWLMGEFEECRRSVAEGLEMADRTGIHILSPFLLGHGISAALCTGDLPAAEELLRKMQQHMGISSPVWVEQLFHTLRLWKALLEKEIPKAQLHADASLKSAENAGMPISTALNRLGKALALQAASRTEEAWAEIEKALAMCKKIELPQLEFACLLGFADLALDSGDETSGFAYLQRALRIGRQNGYISTWFWRNETMTRLCRRALSEGIEGDYVRMLIRRRDLTPEDPPLTVENWPWPVRIFALGRFEVIKDDAPLRFSGKVREKPLALLRAILSMGGRDVSADAVSDALWPENDGDLSRGAFKTNLHRLRRLLGHPEAVRLSGGRLTLDARYCWVDIWAFERLLHQAEDLRRSAEEPEVLEKAAMLLQKALALYQGPFTGAEESRGIALQEHLHNRFIEAACRLGAYRESREEWEAAIALYEAGLKTDELAEAFYRGLIRCCQRLGQTDRALSAYKWCRKTLAAAFGTEPSPETAELCKALLPQKK